MFKWPFSIRSLCVVVVICLAAVLSSHSHAVLASGGPTATPSATERVFFISANYDTFGDFFVINIDGTGVKQITHDLLIGAANNLIKSANIAYYSSYMTKGYLWGGAALSPDGRYIAVAWTVAIFDSTRGGDGITVTEPALYLVDGDTLSVQNIPIQSLKRFSTIAFAPDGKHIAFVADRNGKGQIDWVDLEHDFKIQPLVEDDADKDFPGWSPDGKSLLYIDDKDKKSQVYVADADGSHPHSLTDNLKIDLVPTRPSDFSVYRHDLPEEKMEPTWSPDGKQIAFASWQGKKIASYLMNADGSNVRVLLPSGKGGNAFWLNDQTLFFGSNRAFPDAYQLYTIKADGTGERRMTDHGGGLFNIDISADNKRLVFDTGLHRIYLMNTDGSGEHILRFNADFGLFWEARR